MEKMANSKLMWDFLKGSVTAEPTTHTPAWLKPSHQKETMVCLLQSGELQVQGQTQGCAGCSYFSLPHLVGGSPGVRYLPRAVESSWSAFMTTAQ